MNYDKIMEHNKANHSFILSLNQFADMVCSETLYVVRNMLARVVLLSCRLKKNLLSSIWLLLWMPQHSLAVERSMKHQKENQMRRTMMKMKKRKEMTLAVIMYNPVAWTGEKKAMSLR